jgi:hypothetical protein
MTDPLTTAAASSLAGVLRALVAELQPVVERLERRPSLEALQQAKRLLLRIADLAGCKPPSRPRKRRPFAITPEMLTGRSLRGQVRQLQRVLDDLDRSEQRGATQ